MFRYTLFLLLIGLLFSVTAFTQVKVSGRVYDFSQSRPLEAVSVLSNYSGGTSTDSAGRYTIIVKENDSIWFSYLGKPTPKYPVLAIKNVQNFEVSLHVNITQLKEVTIMPPSYKRDSMENRLEYAGTFNFHRANLESLTSITPNGVGLDIDEVIRAFQFRKTRRTLAFQKRLLEEEQEDFISHRFSRALVIRITQLRGLDLDTFMRRYRPPLEFTINATEYEFQLYIKQSFLHYQRMKRLLGDIRKNEKE